MTRKVVVFGDGGHAKSVIDVLLSAGKMEPVAVVGLDVSKSEFWKTQGIKWFHQSDTEKARHLGSFGIVGIGQIRDPEPRAQAFRNLLSMDFSPAIAVSPSAYVSRTANIGPGTVVFHGAIVNAFATVGENTIINSNSLVEHDVFVGDGSHVSTSATINGGTRCGSKTFIGSGATIKQELSIGDLCFVPMGSVVTSSMGNGEIWIRDTGERE